MLIRERLTDRLKDLDGSRQTLGKVRESVKSKAMDFYR